MAYSRSWRIFQGASSESRDFTLLSTLPFRLLSNSDPESRALREGIRALEPGLLKDARFHRDQVALVAFRHSRRPDGTVCLAPAPELTQGLVDGALMAIEKG